MYRGSLLPSMGGLPRRVPPSPAIALLVTPPPQIGPHGPPSHGGGSKKQLGVPGGPGGNHKCSRCKARPKSGSGSSLCIRCKLQRDYGSPRGGFAAPRKKTPMGSLPMIAISSPAPIVTPASLAEFRNDAPTTPQSVCPPVQAFIGSASSVERPGAASSLVLSVASPVGAISTQRTETGHGSQELLEAKTLIVGLDVDGDVSRGVEWATLRAQEDLTETTWPQFMVRLSQYCCY